MNRERAEQWGRGAILASLFVAYFFSFFRQMAEVGLSDDNWSHALLVPLASAYFVFERRAQWRAIPLGSDWRGVLVLLLGMAVYVLGFYPISNLLVRGFGMVIALLGLGWMLTGARMRVLWFPISYLVFGIKIGDRIWSAISGHLQVLAAHGASAVLQLSGLDSVVRGATIELLGEANRVAALNVAEACSGLRMLMAFVAMGVAVAYLIQRPWWGRLILVICSVPVALVSNIFRVALLGQLYRVNPEWLHGPAHSGIGLLMILAGLGLFNGLGWVLDHLFVGADDESA